MRKHRLNCLMTAAVIASTLLTATACSKVSAPIDTLPMGTELPADTSDSTSTEAASTKQNSTTNKGGNTKETETTKESSNASKDTSTSKDTGTKESNAATEKSGEGSVSSETSKDSEATTKAGGDSSVTATSKGTDTTTDAETSEAATTVTETATSKVTETTAAAAQAPTEKATEKQTEKATEKITESTTQAPTEKATEKQTEKATEKATQPAHIHSYAETVTKQPTCTSEGLKTFKCSCGDTYTESIPAKGHSFGAYTYNNDATELADGTETAICSVCGEKNTRTASGTKLVHVHNYTATVTKAATCAEEGITTYTCSCGDSYTQAIPMLAHSFGEFVYNNDATTEKDGTQTRTCSVCGVTDTVTAEGTKKSLPSWYDEHPDIPLNQTRGSQHDGSLEAYWISGQFDWNGASMGSDAFGYSTTYGFIGEYLEGDIYYGHIY